jgi:hypothetical protein
MGIDVAADVVEDARARLGARAAVEVGDVREWLAAHDERFDVATLLNNVYYFPRGERVALYRQLRAALTDRGELLVVTMVTPGSPASAHLHLMLVSQAGHASLPREGEVERNLREAGFTSVDATRIVPGEPFVAIRAR